LRIESVAFEVPSLRIDKEDILAAAAELNRAVPAAQLHSYCRELAFLLDKCGVREHYIRNRAQGEKALHFIVKAANNALRRADIRPSEIDLLIYCGVGRGFLEPATAYFLSRALGIACECFDVLDACMSWVRALQIAYHFFNSGAYSRILIVNGEFNVHEHGYPELLRGASREKLRHTFPAFTIGEASTATVLSAAGGPWNFHFRSNPSLVNLCAIPLEGYADFCEPEDSLAPDGIGQFVSYGHELQKAALEQAVTFIRETYPDPGSFDWWFPHAASAEICRQAECRLQLDGKVCYQVFPRYGNLVSASIPAALHLALEENKLRRGHRVVLCPASAGMSFALADFVY
jgi:acyl-CoA:acyl-CoA alkyltransferase